MARKRIIHICLSKKERSTIKHFQKKAKSSNARTRCAILLAADANRYPSEKSYEEVFVMSGVCITTVIKTLKQFSEKGFTETITPKRNPNSDTARLKVTGDVEAKIIAAACSPAPKGYVCWHLNLLYNQMTVVLENQVSISRATIGRTLMKNELRPHLSEYWCIPPKDDAEFVANMEDILDVYQQPYDEDYPLWCMDEKPIVKTDSEYIRNGTVSIF